MVLIGRQRECVCVCGWLPAIARRTNGEEKGGGRGGGLVRRMHPSSFRRRTKPEVVSCGVKIRVSTEMGRK